MQFDEALQWCIDNKATYTLSYAEDIDGSKLWSVKVSRGIISAQYPFASPSEFSDAFWMACRSVSHGTAETKKLKFQELLEKLQIKPAHLANIQPPLQPGEVLCDRCDGRCCKYVCIVLPTPRTKEDFDWLRFYVMHENTEIMLDVTGEWSLVFSTPCRFREKR